MWVKADISTIKPKIIDVFICKLRKKLANLRRPQLDRNRLGPRYVLREPREVEEHIPA